MDNRFEIIVQNNLHHAAKSHGTSPDAPYDNDTLRIITATLQMLYRRSAKNDRGDVLVPFADMTWTHVRARSNRYEIAYKWPKFGTEFLSGTVVYPDAIPKGTVFDRLGSPWGRYVSPVTEEKKVASVSERAIPYYFIENNILHEPSYHRYRVIKELTKESLVSAIISAEQGIFEDDQKVYLINSLHNMGEKWLTYGVASPVSAFGNQGTGGGEQYLLPIHVGYLIRLKLVEEIGMQVN